MLEWIRDTWISTALRESIWGYPIISAIHVLGIAWFGGTTLLADPQLARLKRVGFAVVFLSGLVLFTLHPVRFSNSSSFQVKMTLLLLVGINGAALAPSRPRLARAVALTLWVAIIFAARGIAYI